jgi:hypothetical protein
MNSSATTTTVFRGPRHLFALIVGLCGAEGTNPDRLVAALPTDTLTKNRTNVASFKFGSTLTVKLNGGKSWVPLPNLSCKLSLNRMCGLAEILNGH